MSEKKEPPCLEIQQLTLTTPSSVRLLSDVSFKLEAKQCLAIVGESGGGKSTLVKLLTGFLPKGYQTSGQVFLQGQPLLEFKEQHWQTLRRQQLAVVFQDSLSGLNPLQKIGRQLAEVLNLKLKDAKNPQDTVEYWLSKVGLPLEYALAYPHQLSGGMRQRVMLALAIAKNPSLLITDEPTTALDSLAQQAVLDCLKQLKGQTSWLWISHDLPMVAKMADQIVILYQGQVLEVGDSQTLLNNPAHPYTQGLLASALPKTVGQHRQILPALQPKNDAAQNVVGGCPFFDRCWKADSLCRQQFPPPVEKDGQQVFCWKPF